MRQNSRIRQVHGIEGLVRRFDDAQQDDAAQRVGECGVGLPNAFGQTAQRLLGLYAVVLPVLLQAAEIKHGRHLLWGYFSILGTGWQCGGNLFGVVAIALDG